MKKFASPILAFIVVFLVHHQCHAVRDKLNIKRLHQLASLRHGPKGLESFKSPNKCGRGSASPPVYIIFLTGCPSTQRSAYYRNFLKQALQEGPQVQPLYSFSIICGFAAKLTPTQADRIREVVQDKKRGVAGIVVRDHCLWLHKPPPKNIGEGSPGH